MAAQFATPEAINFMAREGRGLICLALTPERCEELGLDLMAAKNESPFETAFTVSVEARDGVTTGISAADRARTIQVAIDPHSAPRDLVQPGPRVPAQGQGRRRARAHRPDRGRRRPRAARRAQPVRRDLRDHERRRDDGPRRRPRALLRPPRAEDDHRRRPDRLPAPPRPARRAGRHHAPADRLRRVQGVRLPLAGRRQAPRRDGQGQRRRRRRRARARALRVPDRRRLPLAALRLRRAARVGARDDRGRGPRRAALPRPGGPRDRPAQQAAGLQPPGPGLRHGRRQPRARPAGRPARLRHRRADPRRPRPVDASASSPTTRRRSAGSRATASRSRAQVPIVHAPNPHNEDYLRAKRDRLGHSLHHQALPLDEEMLKRGARARPAAGAPRSP